MLDGTYVGIVNTPMGKVTASTNKGKFTLQGKRI